MSEDESFDIDHCKRLLHLHARLRMPTFTADDTGSFKVDKIENYMGDLAVARGDLEEARLWADHIRHALDDEWNKIDGWQQHVSKPNSATGPQIIEAKRRIKPDIYDAIREAKWVVAKLTDQIKRLEKDEENASRRYTLLTGSWTTKPPGGGSPVWNPTGPKSHRLHGPNATAGEAKSPTRPPCVVD